MTTPGIPTSPAAIANLAVAASLTLVPPSFSLRTIGSIQADVTFEERHEDSLTITDHPVEQGAVISDHAYLNPVTVEIKIGFRPMTFLSGVPSRKGMNTAAREALTRGVPYLNQVYQNVLALQKNRVLNVIMTGKRLYTNMLIERIACVTDKDTENVLMLTLSCRQVVIVQTQPNTLPPDSNMTNPKKTGGIVNRGPVSLIEV